MLVNLIWRTGHELIEIWIENAYDIFEYHIQCSSLYRDSVEEGTRFYLEINEKTISELPKASLSKRVRVHNHSYENEFNLHVNEISFSYGRMSTKTRFEKEAKGNSEMTYWRLIGGLTL